jgi:hypothetical protein
VNNADFFKRIEFAKSLDYGDDIRSNLEWNLMIEFITDIRDRGGVYSLQAKKLLELLED